MTSLFWSPPQNDTASLQTAIVTLHVRQKIICEFCIRIGHKYDYCIIRDPGFLLPSLGRNKKQYNVINGDQSPELPIEWNSQHPEVHFKPLNSDPKKIHMVSAIMGRLNINVVDNSDVEVYTSDYPL